MKITIKNVKNFSTGDGHEGFNASIYIDGKRAGEVADNGRGGEFCIEWKKPSFQAQFEKHLSSLPPYKNEYYPQLGDEYSKHSADTYIDDLVSDFEEMKVLKRWCKKQTVYSLPEDKKGIWRKINYAFDEKIKEHLIKKHGESVIIANEMIGGKS